MAEKSITSWVYSSLSQSASLYSITACSIYKLYFFLLSPYILLVLALVAAVFTWLGWKGRTDRDRWIELGKIALLAAYAFVVI